MVLMGIIQQLLLLHPRQPNFWRFCCRGEGTSEVNNGAAASASGVSAKHSDTNNHRSAHHCKHESILAPTILNPRNDVTLVHVAQVILLRLFLPGVGSNF